MKKFWFWFTTSASFAFLIAAAPSESNAAEKRYAYAACGTRPETGVYPGSSNTWMTRAGQCPVADETGFLKESVTSLNVHFAVGGGGSLTPLTQARTCVVDYASSSQLCGNWAQSSSTGAITLSPARTYWTSTYATWFGFVDYYMGTNTYYGSQLQGYYVAN